MSNPKPVDLIKIESRVVLTRGLEVSRGGEDGKR
jgi:hypothetical protein